MTMAFVCYAPRSRVQQETREPALTLKWIYYDNERLHQNNRPARRVARRA